MSETGKKVMVYLLRVGVRGGSEEEGMGPLCKGLLICSENLMAGYIFMVAFYIAVTRISWIFVVRRV